MIKRIYKIREETGHQNVKNLFNPLCYRNQKHRTYNENTAIKRLEKLLEKFYDVSKVLRKFIKKR